MKSSEPYYYHLLQNPLDISHAKLMDYAYPFNYYGLARYAFSFQNSNSIPYACHMFSKMFGEIGYIDHLLKEVTFCNRLMFKEKALLIEKCKKCGYSINKFVGFVVSF